MQISFCDVTKLPPRTTAFKTPKLDSFQGKLYNCYFKLVHILMILHVRVGPFHPYCFILETAELSY